MDGQLLINEAQLAVLLGQRRPGQKVAIDYFRGGRGASAAVELGEAPLGSGFEIEQAGPPLVTRPPRPGMPMRIIEVPSRTATIDNDDGSARLTADRDGFRLAISDARGRVIHEGPLFGAEGRLEAPAEWRERVESLHAALVESIEQARPGRRPRLRVIPMIPEVSEGDR
jgi:hypothetical protein